jgi:hypothetical protein
MESGPSKISEAVAWWLVPPACSEEILGDMRERYQGPARYFLEAAHVIPCVIHSRICRTIDTVVALMEAVSMYTAFLMATWWLGRAILLDARTFAHLAIPPVIFLVAMILADAYSDPRKRPPLRPLFGPAIGFALAFAVQSTSNPWTLPPPVFAWGSALSFLLVSSLRLTFPPITDRPQAASAPAFWQKLELAPPSLGLKIALLPCGILLAVIFYLLVK